MKKSKGFNDSIRSSVLAMVLILILAFAVSGCSDSSKDGSSSSSGGAGSSYQEDVIKEFIEAMNNQDIDDVLDIKIPDELQEKYIKYEEKISSKTFDKWMEKRFKEYGSKRVFDEIKSSKDITDGCDLAKNFKKIFGSEVQPEVVYVVDYKYHEEGKTTQKKKTCNIYRYDGKWYFWGS